MFEALCTLVIKGLLVRIQSPAQKNNEKNPVGYKIFCNQILFIVKTGLMVKKRNGLTESEAGMLGYLASKETHIKQLQERINRYYDNPNRCKYCNEILPYEKRMNKFCSSSCSAKFNNKNRPIKVIEKQKQTLFNTLSLKKENEKLIEKKKRKRKICKYCGAEKGKCVHPEICKKHQLFNTLSKFGFDLNTIGTSEIYNEYNKAKKIIENEYIKHINDDELKNKYNYYSGLANFHKILKSLEIETRNLKQSIKEAYLYGKINIQTDAFKYKASWHTTWNNKEVFLRSSYEEDYANFLDENKINYDVECLRIKYFDTIKNEYRCAVPDFYLIDNNEIVEVKSNWTMDLQNLKDKFNAYEKLGYKTKLILEHKETDINKL